MDKVNKISVYIKGSEIVKRATELQGNSQKIISDLQKDVSKLTLDTESKALYKSLIEHCQNMSTEQIEKESRSFFYNISVKCDSQKDLETFASIYDKWTGENTYLDIAFYNIML